MNVYFLYETSNSADDTAVTSEPQIKAQLQINTTADIAEHWRAWASNL